jgi:iron complex outermembrane receptor protein
MTFLFTLLAIPAVSFGGQSPPSQDISSLEQLLNTEVTTVTGASKYQQELTSAPASVSIITADDIRKGGYRTLADALNSVRGFFITYHRSYHFVGVRGFSPLGDYNSRLLVLVDGHRLNDGVYEQAPLGSDFPVDLDLVDRIEVIRGPGSSLYGTNAFLAVINVLTRTGTTLKGGELAASGGSFNAWTGRATGGGKLASGLDLMLSGSYRDSAGQQRLFFPEYVATNNGIAQGLDGETSWDLLAKASWKDLSLLVLHQTRDKDVPTAPFSTIFNDPAEKTSDRHTLAGLTYNHPSEFADLAARLTYNRYEYDGDYPLDNEGTYTLNRDATIAEWLGSDLLATKNFGPHLVTVGMEHRWQFTEQQRNFDVFPTDNSILDDNHRTFVQGYYLQDEYHILQELILNAGLRYDHYNTFGGTLNPRLAMIWKPAESSVLRLSYGEAFRAPNAYELYYDDTISMKGNSNLNPEKIRSAELSYDQYIGNHLRTNITGFYSRISDLLLQQEDPADGLLVFSNQSRAESKGLELQAESKWENGFNGRISYTYQKAKNLDSGNIMDNSPRTLVKGLLTVPIPVGRSFATLETIYTGSRTNANQEKIAGAAVVNLTLLNRELARGLELSASIYNLFDTRYGHPASADLVNSLGEALRSVEQDGITFRMKASYRF